MVPARRPRALAQDEFDIQHRHDVVERFADSRQAALDIGNGRLVVTAPCGDLGLGESAPEPVSPEGASELLRVACADFHAALTRRFSLIYGIGHKISI